MRNRPPWFKEMIKLFTQNLRAIYHHAAEEAGNGLGTPPLRWVQCSAGGRNGMNDQVNG